jgi:putative transposase
MFAAEIRKRRVAHMRGFIQWRWHLDEAFVKIHGKLRYLWRAVDHEGEVLEAVVTSKRNKAAALKLLKRIMKKYGRPRTIVTDGLRAYSAAMREIGNADRQEVGVHAQVHNYFNQERHLVTRQVYKQRRSAALAEWGALVA